MRRSAALSTRIVLGIVLSVQNPIGKVDLPITLAINNINMTLDTSPDYLFNIGRDCYGTWKYL